MAIHGVDGTVGDLNAHAVWTFGPDILYIKYIKNKDSTPISMLYVILSQLDVHHFIGSSHVSDNCRKAFNQAAYGCTTAGQYGMP